MPWPPPLSARWTALALFLLALALHVFVALGGTLIGLDFKLLIVADELLAILAAPVVIALLLRLRPSEAFLMRSAHWSHYVVAGAAAIPLQLFGGSVQELMIEALPGSEAWREMLERAMEPLLRTDGPGDLALLLFGGVLLAAVCEEILFRGMMLQLLVRGGRWATAILVTALLFALFHFDIIGLFPRTLMGVYFGLLVWRSGSIFPAILAHGANNLLAFAALPLADPTTGPPQPTQAALVAGVSALVFGAIVTFWLRRSPGPPRRPGPVAPPRPAPPGGALSGAAGEPTDSDPPRGSSDRTDRRES